jgi:hypothetical protein
LAVLFAVTAFINAALLFFLEPLIAKMILPHLGGTPAVWNTCMVFFQAVLLAGYAGAHGLATRLRPGRQLAIACGLQALVFLVLPFHLPHSLLRAIPYEANPIPWLLLLLLVVVGLPFFVLAAAGPLLQRWFAGTGHPAAPDPYFLYAASNLGSMLALVSYPWLVEPNLRLFEQAWAWAAGYGLLVALTLGCAVVLGRSSAAPLPAARNDEEPDQRVTVGRRLRWVALAFVPSSLMLGVTTYLSTDIATIPLLWVVPLALYLLTFIVVFARRPLLPPRLAGRLLPVSVLLLILSLLCRDMEPPVVLLVVLHLAALFVAALYCHGLLAADRPPPRRLTEFYLWMALGGVLGGMFNALVAPLVFTQVVEYPLALVLVCLLRVRARPGTGGRMRSRLLDWVLPLGLGLLTAGLVRGLQDSGLEPAQLRMGLMFGVPAVLGYSFVDRPLRFALGVTAFLLGGLTYTGAQGRPLHSERSFFGVLRVTRDPSGKFHQLVHGNTIHGRQFIEDSRRREPLSYYHRDGPVGRFFQALEPRLHRARVGVVGLGVGAMAAYAQPKQEWTYYEIDPAVKRLACNPAYFTFLTDCRARKLEVLLGDARLRLREAPEAAYDVFVLDAFSSDAVPVHLLTREALRLYLAKLSAHGLLLFHISNRYLDLKPVVANLAQDAGLVCRYREDLSLTAADKAEGRDPSQWVLMARSREDLGPLDRTVQWLPLAGRPNKALWTDDFSNILSIFKWKGFED